MENYTTLSNSYPNSMPEEEQVIFGMNVERLRLAQNLSIAAFCRRADISRPTLYKIEKYDSDLQLRMMCKIARALNTSVISLLTPPPPQ